MKYVKFNGNDLDFSWCSWSADEEKGFERVLSIDTRYLSEREEFLDLLNRNGIVAVFDGWTGYTRIMVER